MSIKNKRIKVGDLVEVDFDYDWQYRAQYMKKKLYLVVDESYSCYFVMHGDAPVRAVSKKKCRLHRAGR